VTQVADNQGDSAAGSSSSYDVVVVGAGPAGYAAAMRAWDYGKRIALVERGPLGGTGVHAGALSSKTFWELSKDFRRVQQRDRGFTIGDVDVDFGDVARVVAQATREKTEQLGHQLEKLASACRHGGDIDLVRGTASVVGPHTVEVRTRTGVRELDARNIVIATGSRPRVPDNIPVDGERVLTSDHVSRMHGFPESLVIVGAGVTGCEFATVFSNYGRTDVHLIDRADRILPYEDPDIAEVVEQNLARRGVRIHHGANLTGLEVESDGRVAYEVTFADGRKETHFVDRALLSVGRVPNTEGLIASDVGVELDERGYIVDDDTRTSIPSIYAAGDVTRDIALVNIAEMEGRRAVDHMFGPRERGASLEPLRYDAVSTIMFLDPEVAAVGLNELQAQDQRVPYRVAVYGYQRRDARARHACAGCPRLDDDRDAGAGDSGAPAGPGHRRAPPSSSVRDGGRARLCTDAAGQLRLQTGRLPGGAENCQCPLRRRGHTADHRPARRPAAVAAQPMSSVSPKVTAHAPWTSGHSRALIPVPIQRPTSPCAAPTS